MPYLDVVTLQTDGAGAAMPNDTQRVKDMIHQLPRAPPITGSASERCAVALAHVAKVRSHVIKNRKNTDSSCGVQGNVHVLYMCIAVLSSLHYVS